MIFTVNIFDSKDYIVTDEQSHITDPVPLPSLLRASRATYGAAIRAALNQAGYDDMPRNGLYVIGAIARAGAPLSQIIKELGVSKQAAGQLVDTLVLRGYLDRAVDAEDRRRLTVSLTDRGRAAATVSRGVIERIDAELAKRVSAEHIRLTRETLSALFKIGFDAPSNMAAAED